MGAEQHGGHMGKVAVASFGYGAKPCPEAQIQQAARTRQAVGMQERGK